jgi:hypothetical protein
LRALLDTREFLPGKVLKVVTGRAHVSTQKGLKEVPASLGVAEGDAVVLLDGSIVSRSGQEETVYEV